MARPFGWRVRSGVAMSAPPAPRAFRSYHSGGAGALVAEVPLATALAEGTADLSLTCRELCTIPPQLLTSATTETLVSLDLSRNRIDELPAGLACLRKLEVLDLSRNRLRALPPELPPALRTLLLLSNQLRRRSLPLVSLAALPDLTLLDLRYNSKLGSADMAAALNEAMPASSLNVRRGRSVPGPPGAYSPDSPDSPDSPGSWPRYSLRPSRRAD